ncbi:unnamed protein product [Psylliodes chrysocephalus]|uniref:Uncharacterized protein n=1 Tax=Psylliodes chrysocephalus TaxID=3402493 RepID=A0A9P0DAJ9_9CUCU|nr:unnamed protein product [Psylliodes chrysocephala]
MEICSDIKNKNTADYDERGSILLIFHVNDSDEFIDGMTYIVDDDFINPNLPSTSKTTQIRTKLPTIGLICDKYGISDPSAAAIASVVLNYHRRFVENFHKNKVRKERKKSIKIARKEFESDNKIIRGEPPKRRLYYAYDSSSSDGNRNTSPRRILHYEDVYSSSFNEDENTPLALRL